MKYLKSTEDAEDITMELFAELPELIVKYDISYFKSWLYQVAKHRCLKHLRKSNLSFIPINNEGLFAEELEDDKYELELQLSLMEEVMAGLSTEQKRCIELFYLDLKSYQEISVELEISINQVKSAIQNGKRRLKIWMGEQNEKR